MLVEELRVGLEELGDFFCGHGWPCSTARWCRRIPTSPGPSSRRHCRRPPKRWSTCRRASARAPATRAARARCRTTTAAQAPVPQDSVSPAPRSNTRSAMRMPVRAPACSPRSRAAGSAGAARAAAPASPPAPSRRPPPAAPRAGCPSTGWSSSTRVPSTSSGCTSGDSMRGGPMSTLTSPSSSSRGAIMPPSVSTRISRLPVRPLPCTNLTKQRAPLPHCSTSPPSALKMR